MCICAWLLFATYIAMCGAVSSFLSPFVCSILVVSLLSRKHNKTNCSAIKQQKNPADYRRAFLYLKKGLLTVAFKA